MSPEHICGRLLSVAEEARNAETCSQRLDIVEQLVGHTLYLHKTKRCFVENENNGNNGNGKEPFRRVNAEGIVKTVPYFHEVFVFYVRKKLYVCDPDSPKVVYSISRYRSDCCLDPVSFQHFEET
jgi:hypothetical protein